MHYSHKLLSGITESAGVPVDSSSITLTPNVVTGHAVVYRHTGLKSRPVTDESMGKNQW